MSAKLPRIPCDTASLPKNNPAQKRTAQLCSVPIHPKRCLMTAQEETADTKDIDGSLSVRRTDHGQPRRPVERCRRHRFGNRNECTHRQGCVRSQRVILPPRVAADLPGRPVRVRALRRAALLALRRPAASRRALWLRPPPSQACGLSAALYDAKRRLQAVPRILKSKTTMKPPPVGAALSVSILHSGCAPPSRAPT